MSKQKVEAVRQTKSDTRRTEVKLSQIQVSEASDYAHRDSDALTEKKLDGLMRNIVSTGGIRTPLLVVDTGKTDEEGNETYFIVGGHRRYEAINFAISNRFERDIFRKDMEVPVTVMVKAEGQTDAEFKLEVFLASVADNDQREDLSSTRRFGVVLDMVKYQVPPGRAAMEMNLSTTQYGRLLIVAERDWLREYVLGDCITHTDAATILEACKVGENNKNRKIDEKKVKKFRDHFDTWVEETREQIEKDEQKLKGIDKKLSDSQKLVKSRLSSNLVRYWCECLKDDKKLDDTTPRFFRIDFDTEKRTITLPKREFTMDKLSVDDCSKIIRELNGAVDRFLQVKKQREAIEAAEKPLTKSERDAELKAIMGEDPPQDPSDGKDAGQFHKDETPTPADVPTDDEEGVE